MSKKIEVHVCPSSTYATREANRLHMAPIILALVKLLTTPPA